MNALHEQKAIEKLYVNYIIIIIIIIIYYFQA